jgi:NAD(P)-dependent dehydrogenase (short-subunit alcohol dehydrogenase family)
MMRGLKDKVVLVTGAAGGIGRATAMAFAAAGAKLVLTDNDMEGGAETKRLLTESGDEAMFIPADVTSAEQIERMINQLIDRFGRLDCAFNNAGVPGNVSTVDCSEQDWDRVIGVNLKGVWLCLKYEIARMLEAAGGAIVNNSSVGGLVGTPGLAPYTASKHGVIGLTKAAAMDFAGQNIRVNAVCPGFVRTPQAEAELARHPEHRQVVEQRVPMGRMAEPEEIADAVVWLCSDESSYVNGHAVVVDGGYVVP